MICLVAIFLAFVASKVKSTDDSGAPPFQAWSESGASLSVAVEFPYAAYNERFNPDCVYLFGGSQCNTCIHCYNISDDSLVTLVNLPVGGYSNCRPGSYLSDDGILYYSTVSSGDLHSYDINAQNETTLITLSPRSGCLVKHPNDDNLLLINPGTSTNFYIYNISNNSAINGADRIIARSWPSCAVNTVNDENNRAYLYVMGGDVINIERINLDALNDNNNQWELLSLKFENIDGISTQIGSNFRHGNTISYLNYIYLFNSYRGSPYSGENEIFVLDVINWDITYYGKYPLPTWNTGAVLAKNEDGNDQIIVLGGRNQTSVVYSSIYLSNEAVADTVDTIHPSMNPTSRPTLQPTSIPTNVPTNDPLQAPTNIPTDHADATTTTAATTTAATDTTTSQASETTDTTVTTTSIGTETTIAIVSTIEPTEAMISTTDGKNNGNGASSSSLSNASVTTIVVGSIVGFSICAVVFLAMFIIGAVYMYKMTNKNDGSGIDRNVIVSGGGPGDGNDRIPLTMHVASVSAGDNKTSDKVKMSVDVHGLSPQTQPEIAMAGIQNTAAEIGTRINAEDDHDDDDSRNNDELYIQENTNEEAHPTEGHQPTVE